MQYFQTRTEIPDPVLAQQVLSGDQKAFELLVCRYHRTLFHRVYQLLGDYDLAYDVLQEVFLRFYFSLPRMSGRQSFRSWLWYVAHNCCVDELRRKNRSAIHFSQFEKSEETWELLCAISDQQPLPEEVVERRDLQLLLQDAIQTLPLKFRSVVILRYASQMSFSEIGQVLSMPEATAKTSFHRAKLLLRKTLLAKQG